MKGKLRNGLYVCILLLAACGSPKGSVKEYVRNADSASIAFYAKADRDSSDKIVITDKLTISKLGEYIDGTPVEPSKCAETGSIWFYEGTRKKMQVDFTMTDECSHFTYMMNDQLFAKSMSADATKYLKGIKDIATDSL